MAGSDIIKQKVQFVSSALLKNSNCYRWQLLKDDNIYLRQIGGENTIFSAVAFTLKNCRSQRQDLRASLAL